MVVSLSNNKSILSLHSQHDHVADFYVSRGIGDSDMPYASLNDIPSWSPSSRELVKTEKVNGGWKIIANGENKYRKWWVKFRSNSVIFPTREGEYISNLNKLRNYHIYSLSYPGTASTKCVVIFTSNDSGFIVGSKPGLNWAKLSLTRLDDDLILQLIQDDNKLFIIPFKNNWQKGVKKLRQIIIATPDKKPEHKILENPLFFLQMGVRDFFGNTLIKDFQELYPLAELFFKSLGRGNIVHLFGTNTEGFDRMFPDFTIDEKLGGIRSLKMLVEKIHQLGLFTSHHFNPRIADARWIEKHAEYKQAVALNPSGNPWIEFYKNNIYFVMDPNDKKWLRLCLKTIDYFKDIGFDYVEIDQIAYQRNLYTQNQGFGKGYQKLIDLTVKKDIKFWVEGVSDVFRLPPDCYFQVLPRDRSQLWETNENRRGYPYGTPITRFYRTIMPDVPISYQIVTEKAKVNLIPKRMRLAKKLNAQVYDLELGFVDKTYENRLHKTLHRLTKYLASEK